jgi:hypothetical protein
MWDDPEVHGVISFRTLEHQKWFVGRKITAVLIYNISVLSVIYIKPYKS